jgi:hypothetical protein
VICCGLNPAGRGAARAASVPATGHRPGTAARPLKAKLARYSVKPSDHCTLFTYFIRLSLQSTHDHCCCYCCCCALLLPLYCCCWCGCCACGCCGCCHCVCHLLLLRRRLRGRPVRSRPNEVAEQAIELRRRRREPLGDGRLAHIAATRRLGERREQGDRYRVQVLPQCNVVVEATCVETKPDEAGQR